MTHVHFMGREIGYWATDRLGFCRYRSLRLYWRDLARAKVILDEAGLAWVWYVKGKVNGVS